MGICASCWGRRDRKQSKDYQPLLNGHETALQPPPNNLNKVVDILAALSTGKLPSQQQFNEIGRVLLNSNGLNEAQSGGYGPLSENGRKVVQDLKDVIQAALQVGMEKNDDDRLQHLYHRMGQISATPVSATVSVDVDALKDGSGRLESVLPSRSEARSDADTFLRSIRSIVSFVFTSSTFRYFLSDLFLTSREILADAATGVAQAASMVQERALDIEETVRPGSTEGEFLDEPVNSSDISKEGLDDLNEVGDNIQKHVEGLDQSPTSRVRDSFLDRLESFIKQAKRDPDCQASSLTILSLINKYYDRYSAAAAQVQESASDNQAQTITHGVVMELDSDLKDAFRDLKVILERFAGNSSLDPLVDKTYEALEELAKAPENSNTRIWMADCGQWLTKALNRGDWVETREARGNAEALYARGYELIQQESNSAWVTKAREAAAETQQFISAFANDRSTRRLIDALGTFQRHLRILGWSAVSAGKEAQKQRRQEVQRDILGWLLPRLLRALRAVPMPRVEYKSPPLDLVIDSLILSSADASFIPDHIGVQTLNEIHLDVIESSVSSDPVPSHPGVRTFSKSHVHIDGLRLNAHGISYYVNARGPLGGWIGWEDNGLLNVDVGRVDRAGEGMSVDLELETELASETSLFRVVNVSVDVPGLRLSIDESRHWIINKLLQPFLGPTLRTTARIVLAKQIRGWLATLDEHLFQIYQHAVDNSRRHERDEPSFSDYWEALMNIASADTDTVATNDQEEDQQRVESTTNTSLKGITYTTVTQDSPNASDPQSPQETIIAVGVGEQVLPGKGGPVDSDETPADVARESLQEIDDQAHALAEEIQGMEREAVRTRHEIEDAAERGTQRRRKEQKREGWKSSAFDL
ncbi:hypothetical protein SISSUDRAFT_1120040 [Sistotremastrum suecicum HHB10207 ss-3]|uniref:Uncharacterized protein n=1 Tax=Sistotremastrum suecicum HHB10207 ss-3 TaxID=1314776 RepID=A0A166CUR4_9AGAM|nr:hypothetical protein SISSUDRAFT_1120040 [Sistotremastrum suecicum HHB10207 ss-3]